MNTTLYDVLPQLRFTDVPNKRISIGVLPNKPATGVSYHLDIIGCGPHPYESVLLRVEALHWITAEDRLLALAVGDLEEGIDVCRQFCVELDLPFSEEDEAALWMNRKEADRLLLYIIERPC